MGASVWVCAYMQVRMHILGSHRELSHNSGGTEGEEERGWWGWGGLTISLLPKAQPHVYALLMR